MGRWVTGRSTRPAVIAGIVALTLAIVGAMGFLAFQRSLIYYPDTAAPGPVGDHLTDGEEATFTAEDGLELAGWYRGADPAHDTGLVVLYFPGNAGSRAGRAEVAERLAAAGFATLLVDYRGYGGNPGSPTERGLAADARAALSWLLERGHRADQIIYVGESLGTGVATTLAAEVTPAGLVLRSPFTSLADMARRLFGGVPVGRLLRDRYETRATIAEVSCPVVVLAGRRDTLVPVEQSEAVARAAPNLHALTVLPDADHNDARWFGTTLVDAVADLAAGLATGLD